ncbi:hypothetical protein E2C01_000684 [Portunus trituberculatus]|uniref:Uncharacterized protein n=1 Tax=Portunus trituberculatus TaxID=210409 RepID=A0A5B7CF11_PORTR|nr:hypothetical protein [Portunus trituberculatus]
MVLKGLTIRCSHFLASYYPSFHLTLLFPNRAFVPQHTEAPCCLPGHAAPPPHSGSPLTEPTLGQLLGHVGATCLPTVPSGSDGPAAMFQKFIELQRSLYRSNYIVNMHS